MGEHLAKRAIDEGILASGQISIDSIPTIAPFVRRARQPSRPVVHERQRRLSDSERTLSARAAAVTALGRLNDEGNARSPEVSPTPIHA